MITDRVYEDYFKRSRLGEYRNTLIALRDAGYRMVGVCGFHRIVEGDEVRGKIVINRHDVDTSPRVAREMFEIEKEVYGQAGASTFYFRDSTIDTKLIAEIEAYGYETGYHYEELATYEKKHKTNSGDGMRQALSTVRKQFALDLERFRKTTGSPSVTVASHGDFINTRYGVHNYEILRDGTIREECGIAAEAYDRSMMQHVKARYADQILLSGFRREVEAGIREGYDVMMTLTHPRNWKVDVIANTRENLVRLTEGLRYRL